MNRSRSYFKLLEALKNSTCPICALLLEDGRTYLDSLFYESVLDVPTRLKLMESFGFCSRHARQIPTLPAICAPNVGFSIFASDLLRKFIYLGRDRLSAHQRKRTWKSWLAKKPRTLLSLIKERTCPACDHLNQFETYHMEDLLDALGDVEFFDAYKASPGICLPHLFILEQSYSSHQNFPLLLEVQVAKAGALRDTLQEFIRKQDFRFSDQLTPEETTAWQRALDMLVGKPGTFANEMGHDLHQRSQEKALCYRTADLVPSTSNLHRFEELASELKTSKQVTLYLRKSPLPTELFDELKSRAEEQPNGMVEVVTEDLDDVAYLRALRSSGFAVFYGLGLPSQTVILLDRKKGYLLEEGQPNPNAQWRSLKNSEDVCLNLLWHRFGIAVLLRGFVKVNDDRAELFCINIDGQREQWCRFRTPDTQELPEVGARVELFGWEKWHTHVIEVLELREVGATEVVRE
ncbi:MAG TPA: DUF6062 family protein [Candidatus Binatia bacterium]|jgi:hypothetical protein|nr:DUF6062 family protein [Candidatus Binatia bacterium]